MHVYVMTISVGEEAGSTHGIYDSLYLAMTAVRDIADLRDDMWAQIKWEEGETGNAENPTQYWGTEIKKYRYSIMRMPVYSS